MGWLEMEVISGEDKDTIHIFVPESRIEVVNSLPFYYGGNWAAPRKTNQPDNSSRLLMHLSALALTTAADPVMNPMLPGVILATPASPKGGFLPLTSNLRDALAYAASVVRVMAINDPVSPVLSGMTVSFSPASWDFFLRNGTRTIDEQSTPGCPGCPTPLEATPQDQPPNPTLPNYWFVIDRLPTTLLNRAEVVGANLDVIEFSDASTWANNDPTAAFVYTLLAGTGIDKNDEDLLYAVMGISMLSTRGERIDLATFLVNPAPYLKKALYLGYQAAGRTLSETELHDKAERLSNMLIALQTKLFEGGLFADALIIPNFGIFKTVRSLTPEAREFHNAYNKYLTDINNGKDPAQAWNEFISVAAPLAKKAWADYLLYVKGELEQIIMDNTLTDKEKVLAGQLHLLVTSALNWLQYNMDTPDMRYWGMAIARPSSTIWLPPQVLFKGHTIISTSFEIPKTDVMKFLEKLHLKSVEEFFADRDELANRLLSTFEELLVSSGMVIVDPTYEYEIQLASGEVKKVKGKQYTISETEDKIFITVHIPVFNPCKGTNVFYFRWDEEAKDYVIEPRNPFKPSYVLEIDPDDPCKPFYGPGEFVVASSGVTVMTVKPAFVQLTVGQGLLLVAVGLIALAAVHAYGMFLARKETETVAKTQEDVTDAYNVVSEVAGKIADVANTAISTRHELTENLCEKYGWDSPECRKQVEQFNKDIQVYNKTLEELIDMLNHNIEAIQNSYKEYNETVRRIHSSDDSIFSPKAIIEPFKQYLIYGALFVVGVSMLPGIITALSSTGKAIGESVSRSRS